MSKSFFLSPSWAEFIRRGALRGKYLYQLRSDLGLEDVRVIISMMVLCNANVSTEYDKRRSGLSSTPLDIKYDNKIEI